MSGEPTFTPPQNISLPFKETIKPRFLTAPFGDGYAERAGDGINTIRRELQIQWEGLTLAEKNEINTFFRGRKGYLAFFWTPPDEDTPVKWTCETWGHEKADADIYTFAAAFKQSFDV